MPSRWIFYLIAAVAGLELGGLSTVFIRRWIDELPILRPFSSVCPSCGHPLAWRDTVPVLGFLLLKGRCRYCGERIGVQYLLVELSCLAWSLALAQRFGPEEWQTWLILLVLGCMLVAGSFIDFETMLLPDRITLVGAALALAASFVLDEPGWRDAAAGAVAGAMLFWVLQQGYRLWRREDGVGTGDVKLMAMIGAMTGLTGLPLTLLAASAVAVPALLVLVLRLGRAGLRSRIPYGPFLSLGCMLYILYGDAVLAWWRTL